MSILPYPLAMFSTVVGYKVARRFQDRGVKLEAEIYSNNPAEISARQAETEVPEIPVVVIFPRDSLIDNPIALSERHPGLRPKLKK